MTLGMFGWGVLTGLVSAGLIRFISIYFPLFISLFSKEVKLDKKWYWFKLKSINDKHKPIGQMKLNYLGSSVEGTLSRTISNGDKNIERVFKVKGELKHNQLILNYYEENNPIVRGAMVLRLRANREVLFGYSIFVEVDTAKVKTEVMMFYINDEATDEQVEFIKENLLETGSSS